MRTGGGAEDEFVTVVEEDEGIGGVGGCGEDDAHGGNLYWSRVKLQVLGRKMQVFPRVKSIRSMRRK